MKLPAPQLPSVDLEELLNSRHSTREYLPGAITQTELATLLWAGYGHGSTGGRPVPSAGGRYPSSLQVIAGDVEQLATGVYTWAPQTNELELRVPADVRRQLLAACFGQRQVAAAPLTIVITGAPHILTERYGPRAAQFMLVEAGHIGQNLMLAAQGLGLGLVPMGSFDDAVLDALLELPADQHSYYLFAVGRTLRG